MLCVNEPAILKVYKLFFPLLSYEGDHLPTDAQIQNGLFALQNYRKGATAGQ